MHNKHALQYILIQILINIYRYQQQYYTALILTVVIKILAQHALERYHLVQDAKEQNDTLNEVRGDFNTI